MNEITAPASWRRIDFVSDLHLSEDMPLTFAAWRDYLLATPADAVFVLGDLFEAWVGDDARLAGFEADATAVLAQAAVRRPMFFMVGNRDFLVGDEMLAACGTTGLPDPTVLAAFGTRAFLTHGDAWCLGDVEYQQVRRVVRDPAWQQQVLGLPLAERRALAGRMRTASEQRATRDNATSATTWFDVDHDLAVRSLAAADADVLVHGHTHRPVTESLAPFAIRHVLSDWDLDHAASPRAEVLRWQDGQWVRLTPAQAVATAD